MKRHSETLIASYKQKTNRSHLQDSSDSIAIFQHHVLSSATLIQHTNVVANQGFSTSTSAPLRIASACRAGVGYALTKIVGRSICCSRRRARISMPDIPGMRMSEMRQAVSIACPESRNAGADSYRRTCIPIERTRLPNARRIASSSSTTDTIGLLCKLASPKHPAPITAARTFFRVVSFRIVVGRFSCDDINV